MQLIFNFTRLFKFDFLIALLIMTVFWQNRQFWPFLEQFWILKNIFKIRRVAVQTIFLVALPQRDESPRVVCP